MTGRQQKNQYELAFMVKGSGEAATLASEGTEPVVAERNAESPTQNERLMEKVCERENLRQALKRVRSNKGSSGIDGMSVDELPGYLKEHWLSIRTKLLEGAYKPQPVKRVEIEKPDGGVRKLGIPIVRSHCTSYNRVRDFCFGMVGCFVSPPDFISFNLP